MNSNSKWIKQAWAILVVEIFFLLFIDFLYRYTNGYLEIGKSIFLRGMLGKFTIIVILPFIFLNKKTKDLEALLIFNLFLWFLFTYIVLVSYILSTSVIVI